MKTQKLKKNIALFSFILFTLFVTAQTSKTDKKAALTEMKSSKQSLKKSLKGLTKEQLNFKSSPESWSIAECVEHITIAETNMFGKLEKAIKQKANPERHSEVKLTDQKVLSLIRNRDNKIKTSKAFEPSGKYGSYKETIVAFYTKRKSNMAFVKKTPLNLRDYYNKSSARFGTIDALQVLYLLSGHTDRHIAQIEEIKLNTNFPKK